MAKQLQLRRGTSAQHSTFTGAAGEVTIDTDKDVVVVHDGSTAGGKAMVKEADTAYTIATVNDFGTVPVGYTTVIVKDTDRGGTFIWSASGTANDGTVFAGATGYWERQYSGAVNVKWFGASLANTNAQNATAIQNALNSSYEICVDSIYKTDSFTIDVAKQKIVGIGTAGFDFSTSSSINCIVFKGTENPPYTQNGNGLFNLEIIGNGSSGTQTGLYVSNSYYPSGAVSHINIERCNIHEFLVGIYYGDNAYLIRHRDTDIWLCGTCLYSDGTKHDYGENWYFDGCAFYNSIKLVDIAGSGHDIFFHACSFDYSTYIFYKITTASVFVNQCHIEYTHTILNSFCNVSGNEGSLVISDSTLLGGSLNTSTALMGYINSATCRIENCKIHAFGSGVASGYLISTSSSSVSCRNNIFLDNNLASKGMFDINLGDMIPYNSYISSDTATITKVYTGTNIVLSQAGGNQLNVYKQYGAGSSAGFVVYIPMKGFNRLQIKLTRTGNGQTGIAYASVGIADNIYFNDYGLPRIVNYVNQGAIALDMAVNTAVSDYLATDNDRDDGYFVLLFNFNTVNGSGNTANLVFECYGI